MGLAKTCRSGLVILSLGALHACGGSGEGDGLAGVPPHEGPPAGIGVFKDSNVMGLSYTSGSKTGVTGADGTFGYELNQPTTFKVGAIPLGTTTGNSVVTPIDLVAGGRSDTPEVLNRIRFLMMLDADGDEQNGIVISANVQARAANWTPLNFADAGIDAALEALASDARSADGGAHVVPSATVARSHIESTFRCATSGAFRGTFSGSQAGRFGVIITPNSGSLVGLGAFSNQFGNFDISSDAALSIDQEATVSAHSAQNGAAFSGKLRWPDSISGTWSNTGNAGGTFTGTRLLARSDAVYRYSGFFSDPALPESGPVTFDVDAAGHVTGVAYGSLRDQLVDFSGTLVGGTFTATAPGGAVISASSSPLIPTLVQGTWTGTGAAGTFSGVGCRLN